MGVIEKFYVSTDATPDCIHQLLCLWTGKTERIAVLYAGGKGDALGSPAYQFTGTQHCLFARTTAAADKAYQLQILVCRKLCKTAFA